MGAAKREHNEQGALGVDWPGSAVCTLDTSDNPGATVTAFGAVRRGDGGAVAGVVRWNLFVELLGVEQLVASTFQAPGSRGLLISATGLMGDSWRLRAQSTSRSFQIRGALETNCVCSGAGVSVIAPAGPGQGQDLPVPGTVLSTPEIVTAFLGNPLGPFQGGTGGSSTVYALDTPLPATDVTLAPGERVQSFDVKAGGAGGSFEINQPSGVSTTVDLDADQQVHYNLMGSVQGWSFDSWAGISKFNLVTLR